MLTMLPYRRSCSRCRTRHRWYISKQSSVPCCQPGRVPRRSPHQEGLQQPALPVPASHTSTHEDRARAVAQRKELLDETRFKKKCGNRGMDEPGGGQSCPAKGKTCSKCDQEGHLARVCCSRPKTRWAEEEDGGSDEGDTKCFCSRHEIGDPGV